MILLERKRQRHCDSKHWKIDESWILGTRRMPLFTADALQSGRRDPFDCELQLEVKCGSVSDVIDFRRRTHMTRSSVPLLLESWDTEDFDAFLHLHARWRNVCTGESDHKEVMSSREGRPIFVSPPEP
jgi:hypothetical protein